MQAGSSETLAPSRSAEGGAWILCTDRGLGWQPYLRGTWGGRLGGGRVRGAAPPEQHTLLAVAGLLVQTLRRRGKRRVIRLDMMNPRHSFTALIYGIAQKSIDRSQAGSRFQAESRLLSKLQSGASTNLPVGCLPHEGSSSERTGGSSPPCY